jgi:TolB-like protein/Tfp pilus assembly protein PilF
LVGVLVLLVCLLVILNVGGVRERKGSGSPPIHSVAVLPLQNLSGDPAQQYFSDGLTDALTTELSQIRALRVISRTSVMKYRQDTGKSLPEIARDLNVDAVLEGTVQRSADRVRITAQLIYGPGDQHVWASSYERDLRDVLALEADIATAIAGEIRLQLSPQEKERRPVRRPIKLKALEAYLQGQYRSLGAPLAEKNKEHEYSQAMHDSIEFYEEAIREDPTYAPAYVAMAEVWAWGGSAIAAPLLQNSEGVTKARAALRKALELDPQLAEVHMNLGHLAFVIDWDWTTTERELLRAIELNPNLAVAHEWYAVYLDAMGRLDEGMKEFEILQQLDPGNQHTADAFYDRRQFERVIELRRLDIERHAYGQGAHLDLAYPLVRVGKYKEAVDEWIELMVELGYRDLADDLRHGYKRAGFKGAVAAWVAGLEKYKDSPALPTLLPAYLYTILGDKDRAFAWMERAYAGRDEGIPFLNVNPDWDDLRSDPRFQELVRRVGLPR